MSIPTEPIGSIPRPTALVEAVARCGGDVDAPELQGLFDDAVRDTIARLEALGSPVVTDGEQRKYPTFMDYCLHGLPNIAPDGFMAPLVTGHTRRLPRLLRGPLHYRRRADSFLEAAQRYATVPVKQAVVSPSTLSLVYPPQAIPDYPRERFIEDLLAEHVREVRSCLQKGGHSVQIDFTEGRLAIQLDPSGTLLASFIDLNNLALDHFTLEERKRIGVHTCPCRNLDAGACRDRHHDEVDYALLLPSLLQLNATNYYISLADEADRVHVLRTIRKHLQSHQRIFVGVVAPTNPRVETSEEVRDRVLEAAEFIPVAQLGTTDDCGFCPFVDETFATRELAFAKIAARLRGTALAAQRLGAAR